MDLLCLGVSTSEDSLIYRNNVFIKGDCLAQIVNRYDSLRPYDRLMYETRHASTTEAQSQRSLGSECAPRLWDNVVQKGFGLVEKPADLERVYKVVGCAEVRSSWHPASIGLIYGVYSTSQAQRLLVFPSFAETNRDVVKRINSRII